MKKRNLSRGGKTIRNLLATLLLLFGIWTGADGPLPGLEMRFRRLERENLLPESQILWQKEGYVSILVGRTEERWVAGYLREDDWTGGSLESWPLGDGPSPVPLTTMVEEPDEAGQPITGNAMLFLQVPDEAARAVVQVTGRSDVEVVRHGGQGRTETFEGEDQGNGVFYFWMGPGLPDSAGSGATYSEGLERCPYALKLYRADGSLLLEQAGILPEV